MSRPEHRDYFQDLIDDIENKTVARGAEYAEWPDVWAALVHQPETAQVLRKRGITDSTLATEINYITRFISAKAETSILSPDDLQHVTDLLVEDLEHYQKIAKEYEPAEREQVTSDIIQYIVNRTQKRLLVSDNRITRGKEKLETAALLFMLQEAVEPVTHVIMQGNMDDPRAEDVKTLLIDTMLKQFAMTPMDFQAREDLIADLNTLKDHPALSPSPVEVVDFVIKHSPAFEDLLYRNGLRTNDPDREDGWAQDMPPRIIQTTALDALKWAYQLNVKELTTRHFALALLDTVPMKVHLKKLGVKDFVKFAEAFRENTDGMDEKPKAGVSVHPALSPLLKDAIDHLETVFSKDKKIEDVFLEFLKNDQKINEAAKKSGLKASMIKEWRKHYDAELKKEEDKKTDFQIPDGQLEDLFSQFCQDYTALAAAKKFDPMIGGEQIISEVSSKMLKRGKKNPIIIGEPGIGKTKIMEGLSLAILRGDVPKELIGARLLLLDLHQMDDSMFKGVFESRVLPILKGVSERNASGKGPKIILGITEFASAQNSGTHSGDPNGFRGLIKPFLTSGDIILLADATEAEYRQQVEKDPALARRLQPVYAKEPSVEDTAKILQGLKRKYSSHHKLRIADSLMIEIAKLAGRYIHSVNQPDKSIDLLDEACAIARRNGDATLTKAHIIKSVSDKTNIPVGFLSENDNKRYSQLETNLGQRVLAQDAAIKLVASALKRAKEGFKDPNTPIGNFLFVGPTGVGKTELTKALAEFLLGDEKESLVRFDMSEYQEPHSVSRFIGAPPGYGAHNEGGGLINAVRSKPFAVYLYDEVEKAHPDVFNTLLAPFSDGIITDGRGMKGDMRDTINVMTSNIGARAVMEEGYRLGLDPIKDYEAWQIMARPIYEEAVEGFFRPEFLNRLDGIAYFDSLSPETLQHLVMRRFNQTASQLQENRGLKLEIASEFFAAASAQGFDVRYGARPLKRAWSQVVETPLADWLLAQKPKALKEGKILAMKNAGVNIPVFELRAA